MRLPRDFADLLAAFDAAHVRYLVIGGYAVGAHHVPRFTKDIDLLLDSAPDNMARSAEALTTFGAPDHIVAALRASRRDDVVWLGQPPLRIDLLQVVPGVDFDSAWERRLEAEWGGARVQVIGLDDLIASKLAAGRQKDKADVRALKAMRSRMT